MSAFQFVRISSVTDSTHIVIDAPGLTQTYSSGLSPIVVFWSTSEVYLNDGVREHETQHRQYRRRWHLFRVLP